MQNVINFPLLKRISPASIDWDRVQVLRQQRYPQIPFEAVEIIRHIREIELGSKEKVYWSLEINFETDFYPPEIIECSLNQADIIWILDLLDRFGGELICGKDSCIISRTQTRLPMFWINMVDPKSYQGMEFNSEFLYEHFFELRTFYRILGKNLPNSHLIMVFIRFLNDEDRRYFGLIDKTTFQIMLDRIQEGAPLEMVFMLDQLDSQP